MAESHENLDTELTMCDVLKEEEELEDDAKAVLGDSDDSNCTYHNGYVPRQALYACATCNNSVIGQSGGICLACSYACHENHELVELYTKRHFRCDCGNLKFPNNRCRLVPVKEEANSLNLYNHNFEGLYCSCNKPYPDPTETIPDQMIQCVICEDWYHGRHLGTRIPDNEDFGEMICTECMKKHEFLFAYKSHFEAQSLISVDDDELSKPATVKMEETGPSPNESLEQLTIQNTDHINNIGQPVVSKEGTTHPTSSIGPPTVQNEQAESTDAIEQPTVQKEKSDQAVGDQSAIKLESVNHGQVKREVNGNAKNVCFFKSLKSPPKMARGAIFLPENWRSSLCRCQDCIQTYEKENCSYLLDENDTITAYEERGKCRNGDESQYDKGLLALGQLGRVQQMEAIHEYNNMKVKLKDYLKTFADAKRTVSAKDIKDFFETMQQRKRQRVDVPHFCR